MFAIIHRALAEQLDNGLDVYIHTILVLAASYDINPMNSQVNLNVDKFDTSPTTGGSSFPIGEENAKKIGSYGGSGGSGGTVDERSMISCEWPYLNTMTHQC